MPLKRFTFFNETKLHRHLLVGSIPKSFGGIAVPEMVERIEKRR